MRITVNGSSTTSTLPYTCSTLNRFF